MSMTYAQWLIGLSGYLPEPLANTNTEAPFIAGSRYNAWIDRAIEYAELRIYREPKFDFLATYGTQSSTCTPAGRNIAKPTTMIVVEQANVIIPAGDTAGQGMRAPLLRTSLDFINTAWPGGYTAQPQHYAPLNDTLFVIGPNADQAYVIEFYGTTRPTPLSSSNTSTVLTTNFPDLFMAATMISWALYQKNIGVVQAVGQNEGTTWESTYQALIEGIEVEEARKKFESAGWSGLPPTPVATPSRS